MRPRPGTWAEATPGQYVVNASGTTWKVLDVRGPKVLLVDRFGKKVILEPDPASMVTMLDMTEPEVLGALAPALDGKVIADQVPGQQARCLPLTPISLEAIRSHLYSFHGIYSYVGPDSTSVVKQLDIHEADHHSGGASQNYIPHDHSLTKEAS